MAGMSSASCFPKFSIPTKKPLGPLAENTLSKESLT